ncbi:hypothetical protein OOT00_01880 [Desulfobotulus sp. H1]|uniref:Uncharacterized protein n=1 Tax=Desulfobotulus pelophilus TaxID=2823377 RepID=A0ABT3N5J6_9BACT|nr:hypothetical protein [Desulfobotulus pelophilus]MCW7752733.1 hypothetical protein [Desulfobotulus pelophilus]
MRKLELEIDGVLASMVKAAKNGDAQAGTALLRLWAGETPSGG